jgi:uncharacterized membrane protein required for colicin V production
MDMSADSLKVIYYGVSALVIGILGWNGWRQGVARQMMTFVSIICAYVAAWFGASSAAPLFKFLRYPPQFTTLIAGAAVACSTFLALHGLRRIFFKRTAQQKSVTVRLSYGILGAFMGASFGTLLFIFTTFTIRALGEVAKSRIDDIEKESQASKKAKAPALMPEDEPGPLVRNMAKLGTALDEGNSGKFLHRYDDGRTAHVFATLAKVGIMVSKPEAVDRFLSYPGVEKLATHPKLIAVKNDPEVAGLLTNRNFFKLLRHEKVVALAGDREFNALMKEMAFDQALDHALKGDEPSKAPAHQDAPPAVP